MTNRSTCRACGRPITWKRWRRQATDSTIHVGNPNNEWVPLDGPIPGGNIREIPGTGTRVEVILPGTELDAALLSETRLYVDHRTTCPARGAA
jgi:hypothetical protein